MPNHSYDTRSEDQYESEVQKHMDSGYTREEAEKLAEGWWIDPAGGWHSPNEDDPAAMYE